MKKLLISNVDLTNQFPDQLNIQKINTDSQNGSRLDCLANLIKPYREADCVLVLNPDAVHAAAAMLAKVFFFAQACDIVF